MGDSTGNWLDQSMAQRSDELQQAIAHLRKMPDINHNQIGLFGFSQAGWVMPKALLADDRLSFMIAISPAINWQQQARYLTQSRMLSEGYSEQEVQVAQQFNKKVDVLLQHNASYDDYLALMKVAPLCCNSAMSEDRWQFVLLNFQSDASLEWARLKQPFITIFGDNDLNIDVENSIELISEVVNSKRGCGAAVVTLKNADHSLFPAKKPRITRLDSALIGRLVMVGLIGEKAFAKDSLSTISQWLINQQHPTNCD